MVEGAVEDEVVGLYEVGDVLLIVGQNHPDVGAAREGEGAGDGGVLLDDGPERAVVYWVTEEGETYLFGSARAAGNDLRPSCRCGVCCA